MVNSTNNNTFYNLLDECMELCHQCRIVDDNPSTFSPATAKIDEIVRLSLQAPEEERQRHLSLTSTCLRVIATELIGIERFAESVAVIRKVPLTERKIEAITALLDETVEGITLEEKERRIGELAIEEAMEGNLFEALGIAMSMKKPDLFAKIIQEVIFYAIHYRDRETFYSCLQNCQDPSTIANAVSLLVKDKYPSNFIFFVQNAPDQELQRQMIDQLLRQISRPEQAQRFISSLRGLQDHLISAKLLAIAAEQLCSINLQAAREAANYIRIENIKNRVLSQFENR